MSFIVNLDGDLPDDEHLRLRIFLSTGQELPLDDPRIVAAVARLQRATIAAQEKAAKIRDARKSHPEIESLSLPEGSVVLGEGPLRR